MGRLIAIVFEPALLSPAEIQALLNLAREASEDFPALQGEDGAVFPADIEFGVAEGQVALLQIRPFVESQAARSSTRLMAMDTAVARGSQRVDRDAVPGGPGQLRPVTSGISDSAPAGAGEVG